MTPDRRTLLALFSFAFGLRILYAVVFGNDPSVLPVHHTYDFRIALQMAHSFKWVTTPLTPNAPGYLVLLAAAFRVFGAHWWTAVGLNALLGAMTTLFLYRTGERRLGRHVGLFSAFWLGAFVTQMHFASVVGRAVATTFLVAWLVYTLATPFRRMRAAVWTAFLYALLIHTEPMFLLLFPVLLVFLALKATHHRALNAQYAFLFVASLIVFCTPWTVRNYIVHRDLVPISLNATRYTAPLARLFREAPGRPHTGGPGNPAASFARNEREFWRVVRLVPAPADPQRGVYGEPAWSLRHNVASTVNFGLLLPFMFAGAVIALKRRQRAALIVAGTIASYAILRGFIGGSDYARLPVEPMIVLLAFYGLHELLEMRRAAGEPPQEDATPA